MGHFSKCQKFLNLFNQTKNAENLKFYIIGCYNFDFFAIILGKDKLLTLDARNYKKL